MRLHKGTQGGREGITGRRQIPQTSRWGLGNGGEKIEFREKKREAAKCGNKEGRVREKKDLKSIHLSFELPGFVSASHNGNVE